MIGLHSRGAKSVTTLAASIGIATATLAVLVACTSQPPTPTTTETASASTALDSDSLIVGSWDNPENPFWGMLVREDGSFFVMACEPLDGALTFESTTVAKVEFIEEVAKDCAPRTPWSQDGNTMEVVEDSLRVLNSNGEVVEVYSRAE